MSRFAFPVSLDVDGRRCLILGGGAEATDKARKLAAAGASVQVIAGEVEPGLADAASRGEVAWAARDWEPGDVAGAFLVMVTPEEKDNGEALFRMATANGALCCVIDQPAHCHFANPATFRVADLVVALSSGGRAPAVLRRLREDLEKALSTPAMAAFVEAMADLRETTPPGSRIERLKEAVTGFGLAVEVSFPAWFQSR